MAYVYRQGVTPVSQDGNKAVECYERALQHGPSLTDKMDISRSMALIYRKGVPPIAIDNENADELGRQMELLQEERQCIYGDS